MMVDIFEKYLEAKPKDVNIGALLWLDPGKYNMNDTIGNMTEAKRISDPLNGDRFLVSSKATRHHIFKQLRDIMFRVNPDNTKLSYALAVENDNIRVKVYKVENLDKLNYREEKVGDIRVLTADVNIKDVHKYFTPSEPGKDSGKYFVIAVEKITGDKVTVKMIELPKSKSVSRVTKALFDELMIENMSDYDFGGGVLPSKSFQLNRRAIVNTSGIISEKEYTSSEVLTETRQATSQTKESGQMIMQQEYTVGLGKVIFTIEKDNIGFSEYSIRQVLDDEEIKRRVQLAVLSILTGLFNLSKNEQKGTITPLIVTVTPATLSTGTLLSTVNPTNYQEDAHAIIYINKSITEFIEKDSLGRIREVYNKIKELENNSKIETVQDYNEFMRLALELAKDI